MSSYHPKSYRAYTFRRRAEALTAAAKNAKHGQQSIAASIETNGARMSEEGKAMLAGLGETFKGIERAVR